MRPARKSRERNLHKRCNHLWDSCACPWLGRFRGVPTRINLAKWAGEGKRKLTRSEAIKILGNARGAIIRGEFDPKGKARVAGVRTFGQLLDDFERDYVAKRRADGKLRSNSFDSYIARFRAEFGSEKLDVLEHTHRR